MADSGYLFDGRRFTRLFLNEVLEYRKRVLLASGLVFAILLIIYVDHVFGVQGSQPVYDNLFFVPQFIAAGLFANVIFNDMHHPLGRYHYLTLPCSNLERYLSKYLLTGPVFYLFTLAFIVVFKIVAPVLTEAFGGASSTFAGVEELGWFRIGVIFFSVHILFFLGAIYYRTYSLVKTGLSLILVWLSFMFTVVLSVKLVYFDHFDSLFSMQSTGRIGQGASYLLFTHEWYLYVYWALLYAWITFMAYACLRDHEI